MPTIKQEKVFDGIVTKIKTNPKCLVVTLQDTKTTKKTSKTKTKEFRFFDLLRFTNQLQIGDTANITYTENKQRGVIYNKVTKYKVIPQSKTTFIEGTIKNLNNSRAKRIANEVCITLKEWNGGKVSYCYLNNALTESCWFKKDQNVIMEVVPVDVIDSHKTYKVLSYWGR